jgi:cytochrome b561
MLYLLLMMIEVGVFLAWARGDDMFGLFRIPAFEPGNRPLVDKVQDIHATIGWIIVGVAGLHAAAAFAHRHLCNDGVLHRMLTNGGRTP